MNDVRIFRVGPLDDAGSCLYVPVSPSHMLEVVDARDDAEGIGKVVAQWPEGHYRCSPDLASAAGKLGIDVAPLEPTTQISRLWTAMKIALSPDLEGITTRWPIAVLMRGVSDFFLRDVVQRWPSRLSMDIELRGDRQGCWFGALLATPLPGLVLFAEASDAKACALRDGDEQQEFISQRDHLRVSFEPAPEYAAVWLRDFYDIDRMPRLAKRRGGQIVADDEDAFVIGGVLSTLALVEDVQETVYSHTKTPGREVRTFVSPGSPWPFVHVPGS
jgi:hypothetical protein